MFLNRQDRFKQNSTNTCATKYSLDRRWSHAGHGTITTSTQRKKPHLLKTMLASVTTMNLILGTILITSLIRGKDVCHSQSIGLGTHLFENSVENKALVDHTFLSTTNFNSFQDCFIACASDCRRMSYNFQTRPFNGVSHLCELNSADSATDPVALKVRPGFTYHDIVPYFLGKQVRKTWLGTGDSVNYNEVK